MPEKINQAQVSFPEDASSKNNASASCCPSSTDTNLPSISIPLPHLDSYKTGETEIAREKWSKHLEFFLSLVGYAVGLGNIWRFPYLCYQSGGGAFLIPYFFFLIVCGIPLFVLELSLGQFGSLGPITVWRVVPLLKGLGFSMALVSAIVCSYYNVIIAWDLYYISQSITVPWSSCTNSWNTQYCTSAHTLNHLNSSLARSFSSQGNLSLPTQTDALQYGQNMSADIYLNESRKTSSEEFWLFHVLQQSSGINVSGDIRWPLVLTLFIAWIVIFLCLLKGIKSSGKVVYVTSTFPYFVLFCFLVRGLTLPGALNGIYFYLTPQWEKLLEIQVWVNAATQIFYSVGAGWGALLTMASYNKFNNNVYRDAIVVPLINCATSVLAGFVVFAVIGFMAEGTGKKIKDVVAEGPGLAFVVYPEAIARMPLSPIWALLFFLMLFAVGLDTQFGMFETTISAFVDEYPGFLQKRKKLFTVFLCVVLFILGLPCVTQGGMYVVHLMDWYSAAFSLMVICLFENIAIAWIYGVDRFRQDIFLMTNKMPSKWWTICWCYITPLTITVLICFMFIGETTITMKDYVYPNWSIGLGWVIALSSLVPIPIVAMCQFSKRQGTFIQKLEACVRPAPEWGPAEEENIILYEKSVILVPSRFKQLRRDSTSWTSYNGTPPGVLNEPPCTTEESKL